MLEHFKSKAVMVRNFKSEAEGSVRVRLVPYGVAIDHGGKQITFDEGSVEVPDKTVPLTIDHGDGVTQRIGKLTEWEAEADGLYADFSVSDTATGRDVRTLLADGVLDEVSAGVAVDEAKDTEDDAGITHRFGVLDHGSIVGKGAFGPEARVLAVHAHDERKPNVAEVETPAVVETPDDAAVDTFALKAKVTELEATVQELAIAPGKIVTKEHFFKDKRQFVLALAKATRGDAEARESIEKYALADDTTTTATGVVPDFLSSEVISILDTSRPYLESLPRDDIGGSGMTVDYPTVAQKPVVNVQAAEKTEVASQAMSIVLTSEDLLTYAGASDVSRQLIERSSPSFVDILFREYASAYAQDTDGDATAAGVAGAGGTAILADLGADAAATFAAVSLANSTIIAAVRTPISHWALGATRWAELNSLVDADGRPLLVFPNNNPQNAQGQSGFTTMVAQYHGITAFLDPNMVATTDLLYASSRSNAFVEQNPIQLRAEVVSLLGFEMGVYGLFAHIVKYADGSYTFTLV